MGNSINQMQVEFHKKATDRFFSIFHDFEHAVSHVNRRNEEYRFQQLKLQYASTMEAELNRIAEYILKENNGERRVNEIDQLFHQFIKDYLHRFILKVNNF
jgi:hypothetical protein